MRFSVVAVLCLTGSVKTFILASPVHIMAMASFNHKITELANPSRSDPLLEEPTSCTYDPISGNLKSAEMAANVKRNRPRRWCFASLKTSLLRFATARSEDFLII
jgi:hypothetical protein